MTTNVSGQQAKQWRMSSQGMIFFGLNLTLQGWQVKDGLTNNPALIIFEDSGTLKELIREKLFADLSWLAETSELIAFISRYFFDRRYAPIYNPAIPPQPQNAAHSGDTFTWDWGAGEQEIWEGNTLCEVYKYDSSKTLFEYIGTDADSITAAGTYVLCLRKVVWFLDEFQMPTTEVEQYLDNGATSLWVTVP